MLVSCITYHFLNTCFIKNPHNSSVNSVLSLKRVFSREYTKFEDKCHKALRPNQSHTMKKLKNAILKIIFFFYLFNICEATDVPNEEVCRPRLDKAMTKACNASNHEVSY